MLYKLFETYTTTPDGDSAVTYGVKVYKSENSIAPEKQICIYENGDICFCRHQMQIYINLWSATQPSLCHLKELISEIIEGE